MSSYSSLVDPECVTESSRPDLKVDAYRQKPRSLRLAQVNAWSLSRSKRALDIVVSLATLALASVPMFIIAVCIRLTSKGPAIFVQRRVGQGGRLFSIYKFRSMTIASNVRGASLTKTGDARVTYLGRWLRKLKLDELPQFYNVLRGDMSLVGPRPKLPAYAEELNLAYRPGITGAATLAFRHEEDILACVQPNDLESYYHARIKPLKATIDEQYMRQANLHSDLKIVASTLFASMIPNGYPALQHNEIEDFFVPPAAMATEVSLEYRRRAV